MVDAVFNGYFVESKDVGSRGVLSEIAGTAGMDVGQVRDFLDSYAGTNAVNEAEAKGQELGISGVPTFIINNRVSFSGAQAVETFIRAFEQATA